MRMMGDVAKERYPRSYVAPSFVWYLPMCRFPRHSIIEENRKDVLT